MKSKEEEPKPIPEYSTPQLTVAYFNLLEELVSGEPRDELTVYVRQFLESENIPYTEESLREDTLAMVALTFIDVLEVLESRGDIN